MPFAATVDLAVACLVVYRVPPDGQDTREWQQGMSNFRESASARRLLFIFGVWTIIAFVDASQAYVRGRGDRPWWDAFEYVLPGCWTWALLTPLCLRLASRFSVERRNWRSRIPLHLVMGLGIAVLYLVLQSPISILLEGRVLTWAAYRGAVVGGLAFQFVPLLVIYGGIVSVGHVVDYQRRLVERETHAARLESELSSARLESLRAQLQPHFLFNTLHSVGGLVRSGDGQHAIRMLTGLSGLLRHTLDHLDAPEVPLHEEIETVERYLEIEEIRFGDRLEVVRRIDPAVMEARVPALIFQPLLENAMRHGIAADTGPAEIVLSADLVNGRRVRLMVQDDGHGLPADFDPDAASGLGLGLTTRRLASLYGDDHEFRIEPVSPRGTRVVIDIPYRTAAEGRT